MSCYYQNSTVGIQLYADGRLFCPPGYYCPNTLKSNPESTPRMCPASIECGLDRFRGNACEPQGPLEPILCPQGFYCPDSSMKIICPKGNYCPVGSIEPTPCTGLAFCGEGQFKRLQYEGLVLCVLMDFLLLVLFTIRYKNTKDKDVECRDEKYTKKCDNIWLMNYMEAGLDHLVDYFKEGLDGRQAYMDFAFENMSLQLHNGVRILDDMSGRIKASRMTAIMGPSGAGKTTFLNVLCGMIPRTDGTLTISGKRAEISEFKKLIGYVPQDDIMVRELTIRDILLHASRVRLPKTWTDTKKMRYVDVVLEALDLTHVQHVCIGDETKIGISGGQRKRVNIGIELCAIPTCLFLDEPTSGLDSSAALEVCDLLRQLAHIGLTIISVIHQPSVEIFEKFDDILLVGPGGRTVFLGPIEECQPYFKRLGYIFGKRSNPADVLMDIVSGKSARNYSPIQLAEFWKSNNLEQKTSSEAIAPNAMTDDHSIEIKNKTADMLRNILNGTIRYPPYTQPNYHPIRNEADQEICTLVGDSLDRKMHEEFHKVVPKIINERGSGFWTQLRFCYTRSIAQQIALKRTFMLEIFVASISGVVMGLSLIRTDYLFIGLLIEPMTLMSTQTAEWQIPVTSFLCGVISALAAVPSAVKIFSEERTVFWRESIAGHSNLAYFLGKNISVFYRILICSMHFATAFHMILQPLIPFSILFLTICSLYYGIYGLSSFVSMIVEPRNATLAAVVLCLFYSVSAGFAITLKQAKDLHMGWLFNLGFCRWTSEILWSESVSPFKHVYLVDYSSDYFGLTTERVLFDFCMLLLLGTVWRVFAYIALKHSTKIK